MPRTAAVSALHLDLRDGASRGALTTALVAAIAAGQLADGDILPSSRALATSLGVGRSRVVEAYQQLAAAGFVAAVPGGSTRVERGAVAAARAGAYVSPAVPAEPSRAPTSRARPVRFDLLPGYADVSLINARDWNRAWRLAARGFVEPRTHGEALDGLGALQAAVADHLRIGRGMAISADDVVLFPSVHSAISVIASVARDPERSVAFEDPGYQKALRGFQHGGARVRPVPVDDSGLRVAELSKRDWAVYVTPAHQYPLGSRMPVSRRQALLQWAQEANSYIFEDDYDGEFRYGVAPMPPLHTMATGSQRVVYLGTASKILSSELRIAWAVVPAPLRAAVRERLAADGQGANSIAAAALAEFARSGALLRHLATSHRTYAARRDRFAAACVAALPHARIHGIEAGLHLVLTFDPGFDDRDAVARLDRAGLACAPLSAYRIGDSAGATGLVCGYARLPETQAAAAAEVLREVLRSG